MGRCPNDSADATALIAEYGCVTHKNEMGVRSRLARDVYLLWQEETQMIRIQIIDDDRWCAEAIKAMLMDIQTEMFFEIVTTPDPIDGFDIYIIDNEFNNGDHAINMVQIIRVRNPDAMIMACSGTMNRVRFKDLINAGCNAVVEKGSAKDRDTMVNVIERFAVTKRSSITQTSIGSVMADIRGILSTWNARMDSAN